MNVICFMSHSKSRDYECMNSKFANALKLKLQ